MPKTLLSLAKVSGTLFGTLLLALMAPLYSSANEFDLEENSDWVCRQLAENTVSAKWRGKNFIQKIEIYYNMIEPTG